MKTFSLLNSINTISSSFSRSKVLKKLKYVISNDSVNVSPILIGLFLLISFSGFAQKSIQDSLLSNAKKTVVVKELFPFGKGFVKIKSDDFEEPSTFEMESYNLNNELLHKQVLSTERENEWFAIEGTFVWDTTLVVLASLYHPGPQKNHLLLYQYSLPNLELVNSKILLTSFAPPETRIPFLYQLSPDKSKLVISAWSFRAEKANAKIELTIYDPNFNQLNRLQKELPFENRRLFQDEVLIDNQGRCYFIGDNYGANLYNELRPSAMKKFVYAFLTTEKKDTLYQITNKKISLEQTKYLINEQEELIGMTLVGRRGGKLFLDGINFFKINPVTQTILTNYQKIDKAQFKRAFTAFNPNLISPKHSFSDYHLKQIFAIGEHYYLIGDRYEETRYSYDYTGEFDVASLVKAFELQDIFVIKVNASGTIRWMNRVPKKQEGSDRLLPFLSFKAFARKNDLLLFFNDTYKNLADTTPRRLTKSTVANAQLIITQINLADGQFKTRRLQNFLGKKHLTQTKYIQKIKANELFFYANGRTPEAKKSIVKILKLKEEE